MPIPRRISPSAFEAQDVSHPGSPGQQSGVFRAHHVAPANLDELEEVRDDDEFDFPDIPSLMPAMHSDVLMPELRPVPGHRKIPTFELELPSPASRPQSPMFRTSSTANMAAVRPAPAPPPAPPAPEISEGGRVFDSFEDEPPPLDLSLDIKAPPSNQGHSVVTTLSGLEMQAPPPSAAGQGPISSTQKTTDPMPGIVAFAGFGIPPQNLGGTPAYALRVIARKWTLRDDLRIARLRRIQDVTLYEAALRCADEGAVTKGLALIATSVVGGVGALVAAVAFLL